MSHNHCTIVFCFVANDSVGIVEKLSNAVKANQGNWAESHLATMAGLFSGLIKVNITAEHTAALQQSLNDLSQFGDRRAPRFNRPR